MNTFLKISLTSLLVFLGIFANAQVKPLPEWWLKEPCRLVQTNLREIDAKDFILWTHFDYFS